MQNQTTIQCPSCRQPITTTVDSLIDVRTNPDAKMRLLSGRLNMANCPHCGVVSTIASPLLYHDADKELLISFVPMEMNLSKDQQEKAIGELMRRLTRQIPQEQMRGYMFQPKQALTMQNLVDQVLVGDGITPEVMEGQRKRVQLIEALLQTPEENLDLVLQERDAEIDAGVFQAIGAMGQRAFEDNHPELAEALHVLQAILMQKSTFGQQLQARSALQEQLIQEVAEYLGKANPGTHDDFVNIAIEYAGDEDRLQALVGLARPVFDYAFFQALTARIEATPPDDRPTLITLREQLTELTNIIDQQQQLALRQAVQALQLIANSPDLAEAVRVNAGLIDDTFLAVLTANIQEAERRNDPQMGNRLKEVYEHVRQLMEQNAPPELRFVNLLLSTATDEEARDMVLTEGHVYGPQLLDAIDAVGQVLAQHEDEALVRKLSFLREVVVNLQG
jgi:hypothetical protein